MTTFTESVVEAAALAWIKAIGWHIAHGAELGAERGGPNYRDVVLESRLRQALAWLTPTLPPQATGKTTGKLIGKATGKTPLAVFELLAGDPTLTVPQLAARLEKSELTIHRAIRTLRESGRPKRVGPDKRGYWRVIE